MSYTDLPPRTRHVNSRDSGRSAHSSGSRASQPTLADASPYGERKDSISSDQSLHGGDRRYPDAKELKSHFDSTGVSSSIDAEAGGGIHHRVGRRRLDSAADEHTFFSSIRDNDEDNNWDDLDEVDLEEDVDGQEFDDMLYEQVVDPDDPVVTGTRKQWQEDYEDVEKQMFREMSYKQRRKQLSRIKIEYNISCALFIHTFSVSRDLILSYCSYRQPRKVPLEAR